MTEVPGMAVAKASGGPRIHALDALRGIAALIVVFHHLDNTLDPKWWENPLGRLVNGTPLRLLTDGRAAVMLFFVLSGFALSISIGRNFNYWNYLVKRVCRLMIPCIAGVLLAAGVYLLVAPKPIPELSPWFNSVLWNDPVTPGLVLRHILMTGTQRDTSLINVLWSLVIELRISLIFPALYFLSKRRTKVAAVSAIAIYALFRYLEIRAGNYVPFFNRNVLEALENIGYYTPFFIAGIVARENIEAIRGFLARFHKIVIFIALLIGLRLEESGIDFQIGVGAFLIIVLCVGAPYLSRGLSIAPIEWLGKVSYSLYLVHLTVLAAAFHLLYGKVNTYLLSAGVVAASLILADVFYRLVEAPSIQLGHRLTARKPVPAPAVA